VYNGVLLFFEISMQQILQPYPLYEGTLSFPASFIDHSVQQLAGEWLPGKPLTLLVNREQVKPGEANSQFTARHLKHLGRILRQYRLMTQQHATLGTGALALPGEQIQASYKADGQTVFQRQGIFLVSEQRALILSATSNRHLDEQFDPFWQQWLASFVPAQSPAQAA
jgi:hypothetical protein